MRLSRDQIGGLFMLCFSCAYSILIFDIPKIESASGFDARSMPIFLGGLGTLFSLILLSRHGESASLNNLNFALGFTFVGLLIIYSVSLRPIGFLLSTTIFLFAGFWLLGERRLIKNSLVAVTVSFGFWLIMSELLGVYLPAWPEFVDV